MGGIEVASQTESRGGMENKAADQEEWGRETANRGRRLSGGSGSSGSGNMREAQASEVIHYQLNVILLIM